MGAWQFDVGGLLAASYQDFARPTPQLPERWLHKCSALMEVAPKGCGSPKFLGGSALSAEKAYATERFTGTRVLVYRGKGIKGFSV